MATKVSENGARSTLSPPQTTALPGQLDRKTSMASTRRGSNNPSSKGNGNTPQGARSRQIPDVEGLKTGATTPQLENTYKLMPEVRFNARHVEATITQILDARLAAVQYSPDAVKSLTKELSETINSRVKSLGFSRHKLVTHVIMGRVEGQGVRVASRCIWNDKQDDFASVSYQNASLFAVASVYGIYFE